jgi:hypothetical protein
LSRLASLVAACHHCPLSSTPADDSRCSAWRVTVYLQEEAWGAKSPVVKKIFPVFRFPTEKRSPLVVPGLGEPGVNRGMPGVI